MLVITGDLINQLRLTGSAEPDRTVTSGSRSTAAKVRESIVLATLSSTPLITRRSKVGDLGRDLYILLINLGLFLYQVTGEQNFCGF